MPYEWIALGALAAKNKATAEAATQASRTAANAEAAIFELRDQVERQALLIRSLLLVLDRRGLTNEDDFREIMEEVDLSDGRRDGRYRPLGPLKDCPRCSKVNKKRAVVCLYCGTKLPQDVP